MLCQEHGMLAQCLSPGLCLEGDARSERAAEPGGSRALSCLSDALTGPVGFGDIYPGLKPWANFEGRFAAVSYHMSADDSAAAVGLPSSTRLTAAKIACSNEVQCLFPRSILLAIEG